MNDNHSDQGDARWELERRCLQVVVVLASLVPILAGATGVVHGTAILGHGRVHPLAELDSHLRYLSGLLLALGIGFAAMVPWIETCGRLFRCLALMVLIGGMARLGGIFAGDAPSAVTLGALAMELLVTPALALWQDRIARLNPAPFGVFYPIAVTLRRPIRPGAARPQRPRLVR